jgi:UDP-galactopyranose mutase
LGAISENQKRMKTIAIVGTGFTGAIIANRIASELDVRVVVFDERAHVAGNCYTSRDNSANIMVHHYGPHIFHTSNLKVWNFINTFSEFHPFINRVKAITPKGFFSLPINLTTINQFFGKTFRPEEARKFIEDIGDKTIQEPKNFEEQALKLIGHELYYNFFKEYTIKQWGVQPSELPASILKRLPIRFNCDDNYYNSIYQGIPKEGYTPIIEKLLFSKKIEVKLNTKFRRSNIDEFDYVFFTGPIDKFYEEIYGSLGYRSVYFEKSEHIGDFQGNPVINFTSFAESYTRVAEYKHFTPWESHEKTLICKEYSKFAEGTDIPYYPMRRENDMLILEKYFALASQENKVSFLGRLATYRYLDMHSVIEEALDFSNKWLLAAKESKKLPIFN